MSHGRNIPDIDHEFHNLRISALTNALKISPYVKEVTLGPNSVIYQQKEIIIEESKKDVNVPKENKTETNWREETVMTETGARTYDRLLHDFEDQRKEAIKAVSNHMLKNMAVKRMEVMKKFWRDQALEYERKAQERCDLETKILEEWAVDDELARIEQEKLDQMNKAHLERMKNLLERQLLRTKLFEALNSSYANICEDYKNMTSIACSDNNSGVQIDELIGSNVAGLLVSVNQIIENCKTGNITVSDVNQMKLLESQMNDAKIAMNDKIQNALNNAVKHVSNNVVEKSEKKLDTTKENINAENVSVSIQSSKEATRFEYCSKKSLEIYCELLDYLNKYEQNYKNLLDDSSLKKFRFDCQKAVNTPVNAISSLSGPHIKDKFQKLSDLLNGNKVLIGDTYVSAAQHPQGKAYCTDLLARKIVKQGELLVSSHPEAAFPIASVTVALWACFPEFGKLLCAHFYKNCPYLIPMMMPQVSGQTNEDFYKSRGYKYSPEGVIEKQDQFLKRISGIFKLFVSIWITRMPQCIDMPHPQDLSHAWRWFAAFSNLSPEIDISATLLCDFLTTCGSEFSKCYKKQFTKVLKYLVADYLSELGKVDNGGPKTRLDVFIQKYETDNFIAPPIGQLPDKLW